MFNGEKYLPKCLDSLINQGIPISDYEIICVDDCSTDNSIDLIAKYQLQYQNIKLIRHTVNSRTATAFNTGLKSALGKYVWFVAQDDWIETNCLKRLIHVCETESLDLIAFNYIRVDENENLLNSVVVFSNSQVLSGRDYIHNYFNNDFEHYLLGYQWRAMYNLNYLNNYGIRYQDGAIYEDTTFFFKAIVYAHKFISIEAFLYYYRVNTSSISNHNKKYKGNLIYQFAFIAGTEVLDLSNALKNTDKNLSDILHRKAIWYFESFSYKVIAATVSEKVKFYKLIHKNKVFLKDKMSLTAWYIKLFSNEYLGFVLSIIAKPIYLLKNRIMKKNKLNYEL